MDKFKSAQESASPRRDIRPAPLRTADRPRGKVSVSTRSGTVGVSNAHTFHNRLPHISRNSDGSVRIRHTELVTSVVHKTTPLSFEVLKRLEINPGLRATFPWLAIEAEGFENYSFSKLSVHYFTRVATSEAGVVMMAFDYDPSDDVPVTEQQFSNYAGCCETSVWMNASIHAKPSALFEGGPGSRKFIRQTTLPPDTDIRTSDCANLYVCYPDADLLPAAVLGKLWIEYEVTLFNPHVQEPNLLDYNKSLQLVYGGGGISTDSFSLRAWNALFAPVVYTDDPYVFTGGLDVLAFNDPITVPAADSHSYILFERTGRYLVSIFLRATGVPLAPLIYSNPGGPNPDTIIVHANGDVNDGADFESYDFVGYTGPTYQVRLGTTGGNLAHYSRSYLATITKAGKVQGFGISLTNIINQPELDGSELNACITISSFRLTSPSDDALAVTQQRLAQVERVEERDALISIQQARGLVPVPDDLLPDEPVIVNRGL